MKNKEYIKRLVSDFKLKDSQNINLWLQVVMKMIDEKIQIKYRENLKINKYIYLKMIKDLIYFLDAENINEKEIFILVIIFNRITVDLMLKKWEKK